MKEIDSLIGRTGTFKVIRLTTKEEAYYIISGGFGVKGFNQKNGWLNNFNFNEWGQHTDYQIFELTKEEIDELKGRFL